MWSEYECPKQQRKWKMIADEASVIVSERISKAVDKWQRENCVLSVIDKEILHAFTHEFGLLETQVHEIECKYNTKCSIWWKV